MTMFVQASGVLATVPGNDVLRGVVTGVVTAVTNRWRYGVI